jgi:hypothetical protein
MATVNIGTLERNRLVLEVLGREHPNAVDSLDGNWLTVNVSVEVGAWLGRYGASLRVDEFERLLRGVRNLNDSLRGTAEFQSMEEWLHLKLTSDGLGHVTVEGVARDAAGIGNTLSFHLALDQTFLPALIEELEGLLEEFPSRGALPPRPD